MVSLGARAIVAPQAQVIPPNAVGTWRLDSLIDQARIEGMARSDVDPRTFVLQELLFPGDSGRIETKANAFGQGTIERCDDCVRLKATGSTAQFTLTVPETRADAWGLVAANVRSHGVKEIALMTGDFALDAMARNFGMFGGGGGGPGGPGGPGIPLIPIQPRVGAQRPPTDAAAETAAAGNATNVNTPPPPPGGGGPVPAPAAGGAAVIQGPGGQVVLGGPGGLNGPRANNVPGVNPRLLLGNSVVTLADAEEWQLIGRTKQQFNGGGGMGGFFGGNGDPPPTLKQLTLVVFVPEDKKESGVELDLDYVHVLDAKADYAKATAAATTVERRSVLHSGIFLNTPSAVSYTLVAPEKARLVAGLTALSEQPLDFYVHVSSPSGRKTVFQQVVTNPTRIENVDVDLSEFAGQTITLTLEAVEQEEATVAFLLQPLVFGKRKEGVRNALLYFCDTLRADGLSSYGNPRPTTPNLDRIASEGVRFERCFSQGSWTYVSMPSSLSSLTPSVSGVRTGGERIPDSAVTMAEVFRNAGYLTCALIRNDFVGPTTNTQQGFDFFFQGQAVGASQSPTQAAARQGLMQQVNAMLGRPNQDALVGNINIFAHGSSSDLFATVEPWLAKYADIPFFLYLHSVEPHDPYDPVKEDWSRFLTDEERAAFDAEESKVSVQMMTGGGGGGGPNANGAKIEALPNAADYPVNTVARRMADAGINPKGHVYGARSLYDAEILFMDRYVQSVVDRMQELGLWRDLVFSFNADHGEELLDHNMSGHGHSVYAELNHVPWILRAPGILTPGTVVKDNVANLDLAPTLLGLCGLVPDEGMQGRDLVPALAHGEEFTSMQIVTELWGGGIGGFGGGGGGGNMDEELLGSFSVIEGRWKTIIKRFHKGGANPGSPPNGPQLPGELVTEFEVYDLDADLSDSHPVTDQRREEAKATLARFEAWVARMRELHKRYAGENLTNADADATLRALGYAK